MFLIVVISITAMDRFVCKMVMLEYAMNIMNTMTHLFGMLHLGSMFIITKKIPFLAKEKIC